MEPKRQVEGAEQQARVFAATALSLVVLLAVVSVVALGGDDAPSLPPAWLVGAQLGLGVVLHVALEVIGYRGQQLAAGATAEEVERHQAGVMNTTSLLRMAVSEVPAMMSIALTAALGGGLGTYALGGIVSAVLIGIHVWPWERPRRKIAAAVRPPGAIQEL